MSSSPTLKIAEAEELEFFNQYKPGDLRVEAALHAGHLELKLTSPM
jgi:hypothetical protein